MAKKQKILYLTIKDLKALGLLKKKSKRRKSNRKYYIDSSGQVKTTALPSSAGLYSGPAVEKSQNVQLLQDEKINEANRFKLLIDNKISSVTDIQDKDRLLNSDKFKQAENLYNDKVVPLINKSSGSTVGTSDNSDTFQHTSNTASRFQVNDMQPTTARNTIQSPSWAETQEKLNKELREANVIKELQLKHQQMELDTQKHDKVITPPKPTTLRGN